MNYYKIIPFILFGITLLTYSQNIYNLQVKTEYDTLLITYDILGTLNDDVCEIKLEVSDNGGNSFDIIPQKVIGDIGVAVKPGQGRKIAWLPLEEGLELKGDAYLFKLTGKVLGVSKYPEFVKIPKGSYIMGNMAMEGLPNENKIHRVNISEFEISMYEVTNHQFAKFLNDYRSETVKSGVYKGKDMIYEHPNGLVKEKAQFAEYWKPSPGKDYYPVVNVTWYGAYEYCKYNGYRLPSEAEWEYVARELGDSVRFGNGQNIAQPNSINFNPGLKLNENESYTVRGLYRATTSRVCNFTPNKINLFDMSGNVWEWCQDWYESNYYFNSQQDNPSGPWFGNSKVIRGGSWFTSSFEVRNTLRYHLRPIEARGDVGFRVVREITVVEENDTSNEESKNKLIIGR